MAASIPMGIAVYSISLFVDWSGGVTLTRLAVLISAIGVGVASFIVLSYLLKSREMAFLASIVTERWGIKRVV